MENIPLTAIKVHDDDRQRKTLTGIEDLMSSIERIGLLNPLVLDAENNLIAGRRRFEALKRLGRTSAPVRRFSDLDVSTRQLIELDENLRRVDLPWQETALAVYKIHTLKAADRPTWEQRDTAEFTGLSSSYISNAVAVGAALARGDEKLAACGTLGSAADLLRRRRQLALDAALGEEFGEGTEDGDDPFEHLAPEKELPREDPLPEPEDEDGDEDRIYNFPQKSAAAPSPSPAPQPSSPPARPVYPYRIISADFIQLLESQSFKQKFNLLHCDFPYGINFDRSAQGGSESHDASYEDSPETFWALTDALLKHQESFVADSAHMIFWYSMNYHRKLVHDLEAAGWFVVPTPLIWYKSDGAGIASDYRRRPKHIYETALFCSRGDRPILQLRNDVYACGLARHVEAHPSAKPQEMLEYFLSMVVTEYSNVLDPTAGSGTAIRAAAALGAKSAIGLELNPTVAATSAAKLNLFLERKAQNESDS